VVEATTSASLAAAMGPVNNPKALLNARLSAQCSILADIAEPPNLKQAFDASLSFALLKSQMDHIDMATGIPLVTRDRRGVAQVRRMERMLTWMPQSGGEGFKTTLSWPLGRC
jgi:hypothetical protein